MTTHNDAGPVVLDHVVGDRGRLAVQLASAELRLAATDGDRVVVRTPHGKSIPGRVVVETSDDGVTIREKESGGLGLGRGTRVVQLEIELPRMAEVAVSTASGWLDALGLAGEQRYRSTSGEVRLREGGGQIELTTVSGDVLIDLAAATDLAIKSVSGDAVIRGGSLDALRIGTTSGDVRIDSPLLGGAENRIETLSGDVQIVAAGGMRVEARTVSGDLMTNLPHKSEGRMGRRTLIVGDGSTELSFRSVSGDLRIHDGTGRSVAAVPAIPPMAPLAPLAPLAPEARFGGGLDLPDIDLPDIDLPDIDLPDLVLPDRARPGPEVAGSHEEAPSASADASADPIETERMAILRALEAGDVDVATAMHRLATLDTTDATRPAHG